MLPPIWDKNSCSPTALFPFCEGSAAISSDIVLLIPQHGVAPRAFSV